MLIARSVLSEVARNVVAALTATTGVVFFLLCITFLKRTPGVGLGFLVEVFPLFFPLALQFTVPLAVLTGVVLAFSRLAQDGELTALAAAGVPLRTIARPVLALAALVALAAFLLSDVAGPFAAARLRAARRDLLHQFETSFRAGLSDLDLGRGRISFESLKGREFTDVCLEWRRTAEDVELWRAQKGSIAVTDDDRVLVELKNAQAVFPRQTKRGEVSLRLGDFAGEFPLAEIVGEGTRRRKRTGMTAAELAYVGVRRIGEEERTRVSSVQAREELARRTALAGSAFFFALIGIPLGILTARGGRVGAFLLAIGPVLIFYFPMVIGGSSLARSGTLLSYPALWAGNLALAVVGVVLLRRIAKR